MSLKLPFRTISLLLLSAAMLGLAVLNFEQRTRYELADDGVSWIDSREGVKAWIVVHDGPGDRAGIREGDALEAVNGQPIRRAVDAVSAVFHNGVWSQATYDLNRNGSTFRTTVVIAPESNSSSVRYYLELVGLLYLLLGIFLLVRRSSAPKAVHFYLFCLASFVLYTFSYTGKLNLFDWTIYWLNVLALLLQPALFLHFCLSFPERLVLLRKHRHAFLVVYAPGTVLLAAHVFVAVGVMTLPGPLLATRWYLDRLELIYLALFFVAGAMALEYSYRRAQAPLLKQQLKWARRGTYLAIVPFATLYALPYFLGFIPAPWMKLSAVSLVFLPLTFGYAILRYRLMDVDVIFRRGIAYTLATATIVALYFGLVGLFADFFRTKIPITGRGGWVLAIIITAFLFQPLVDRIQSRLERFFNRERYDYRRTLLEFARELTTELHVDRLLDGITERISETLAVDQLAVFLAHEPKGFRLVKGRVLTDSRNLDLGFLDPDQPELEKGYLFFDSFKRPYGFSPAAQATIERLALHYYLPFSVKGRTLGYLGLGKTHKGDFLSSEDIDLLRTIAGYLSIALENARLYESLEEKALEYQTLKDFSESIVESIDGGVVTCNLEGAVESWNPAMEKLYGLTRSEVTGKKLEDVFPSELLQELPQASETRRTLNLFKFCLRTADARQRIVNLSAVPLVRKDDQVIGRLLIFNDLTERVNLEDQLVQAEKLSSIGLLAAGVAHEVNTPLAVITSQAQMLMRQISLDDSRSRVLQKIIKQAFRASEIVNNLLKFSRVSGAEHSELDLNKLIRETLSLAEPMLRASKISVNVQLTSSLPLVKGNAGKLQQVFMNLIMNARDAMPHGGELTVASECEDSTVQVEFSDTGIGIGSENLNKIFDPFFTTKSGSRGTGLGLAVTYGIVHEHSGKIQVESQVGRGTCFRLEFPTARKEVSVS